MRVHLHPDRHLLAGWFLLVLSCLPAIAATRIGSEALVPLPKSAEYSGTVNIRPGNGETITLNPPIFSWFYVTNIATASAEYAPFFEFQFEVATDNAFATKIVAKRTLSNLYNTLAPFTNANGTTYLGPLYWRVGYIAGGTTNFYWTNVFTISATATNWDRSMLADESYLAGKFVHPHILINANNRAAVYQFARTNDATAWANMMATHSGGTNLAWWSDNTPWPTNDSSMVFRAFYFGPTLTYWALSQDPSVTNHLAANYDRLVNWYIGAKYETTDYGSGSGPEMLFSLVLGYDWLNPILTPVQRSNAVFAIQRTARTYNRVGFWSTEANSGHAEFDYSGAYSRPRLVPWYQSPRTGTSHQWRNSSIVSVVGAAAYGEGGDAREFFDLWINYMIGRAHFCGGFAALNQGRGYGRVQVVGGGIIWNTLGYASAFPEAQLERIPWLQGFADWMSRMTPPGWKGTHGTFGDGGDGVTADFTAYWNTYDFRALALLTGDGNAWLAHQNESIINPPSGVNSFYTLPTLYAVWPPPNATTNTIAKAFIEDGWIIASSKPANAIDAFTNGLGFVFCARPRGTEGGHSINCDGAVEMWAYGAKVTDAGGWNLDSYGYMPEAQDTLFVNGQGEKVNYSYALYSPEQVVPWYARIAAYTNSAEFTYALGDLTPAFTNKYNPQAANVLKVQRHVFFSRTGKYFMLFDELASRTNSIFDWQWHVLQPGVANITTSGFRYGSTNKAGQTITNHVYFATSGLNFTNMTGADVLRNPRTGVLMTDGGDPFRRANALWYRNSTPSTNFTFLSVIVPQEPGKAAPTFTRLDDNTVVVTYGGVTETNMFGTNYTGPTTYRIETIAGGPPRLGGPSNLRTLN